MSPVSRETDIGPLPDGLATLFGSTGVVVRQYAEMLATEGELRGLIGPKEVPRLWDRHIGNSAVLVGLLPESGNVIDIGTGAGLPGIVLAIARPDLNVILIEPMARRTEWLEHVVSVLRLSNVTIMRGRADEYHGVVDAAFVTARAVARLDKLSRWALPLVKDGGELVLLKGASAQEEVRQARRVLSRLGASDVSIERRGNELGVGETTVVRIKVKRK